MTNEMLTPAANDNAARRVELAAMRDRGEIDAELYADLAYALEADARDEKEGREPLLIDYGSRCSHNPARSRWTRVRQLVGARLKLRSRSSMRSPSISGSR